MRSGILCPHCGADQLIYQEEDGFLVLFCTRCCADLHDGDYFPEWREQA